MRDKVRWKKCVEYANDQMGLAVGAMFIRDNFRRQSKQTVGIVLSPFNTYKLPVRPVNTLLPTQPIQIL